MEDSLAELKRRLAEIDDLERTQLLLQWDTEVWMPPAGESSRGAQLETLETIVHERQIDDRLGELLDEVEPYAASLPPTPTTPASSGSHGAAGRRSDAFPPTSPSSWPERRSRPTSRG